MTITKTTAFSCESCGDYFDEPGEPIYECGACGDRFAHDPSEGRARCPDCNRFATKEADASCPNCGDEIEDGSTARTVWQTDDGEYHETEADAAAWIADAAAWIADAPRRDAELAAATAASERQAAERRAAREAAAAAHRAKYGPRYEALAGAGATFAMDQLRFAADTEGAIPTLNIDELADAIGAPVQVRVTADLDAYFASKDARWEHCLRWLDNHAPELAARCRAVGQCSGIGLHDPNGRNHREGARLMFDLAEAVHEWLESRGTGQ